ncbi:MAG: hypothetical protein M0031_00930 [Thermaerobacter sp.]|nr:hypothetical protein [Thermaerobacter sp.]
MERMVSGALLAAGLGVYLLLVLAPFVFDRLRRDASDAVAPLSGGLVLHYVVVVAGLMTILLLGMLDVINSQVIAALVGSVLGYGVGSLRQPPGSA